MATRTEIAEVYVATFNRAADADGLGYWDGTGTEHTTLTDITDIATAMLESPEVKAMYGDPSAEGFDREAFIIKLYANILNKTVDGTDDGVKYWVGSTDISNAKMIIALINGAKADTGDAADKATLANKTEVGLAFADAGLNDVEKAKEVMSGVTDDPATVTTAKSAIEAIVNPVNNIDLVAGAESASPLMGTDGADVFNATVSNLSTEKTLDSTDSLDGGAGEDTLKVSLKANFTGLTGDATIKNIETVALTNDSTIARTFDNSGITGVNKYTIDAAKAAVNLTDMAAKADIDLSNQASGTFSTKFATGASELTATDDSIKLGLSNVGTVEDTATTATEEKSVAITLTDIETVNVTATGDNVVSFAGTDLTALNIEGAGNIKLTSAPTSLKTVDASSATGKVDVNVTNASAIESVKTGTGDDTITIKADNSLANATISGGDGADTLSLDAATAQTVQYQMTGVETVSLGRVAGALTFSGSKSSDITTINTKSTVTAAANFVGMGSADLTLNALGATVDAGDVSIDTTGKTTVNYTADAASVTAKTAQTSAADFTLSNSSGVTINVGEYIDAASSDITAAKATSVTLNVASGKDSAATPVELTKFGGTITAAKATSIVVDSKGQLASNATINAASATTANITNGSTAATLALTTAKLEELTLVSDSSFSMAAASDFSSLQSADITMNNGTFSVTTNETMTKLSTLTVSGTGTSTTLGASQATFDDLGGDNDYALTVTAEGLKGGLTIGTMNASSGQNIIVDATKVTGNLSLGDIGDAVAGANVDIKANGAGGTIGVGTIGTSGTGASSVKVNTEGATKAVTVGAITSTGTVDINLKGNLDTSTVGAIVGKSVTIDASNTIKAVTIGTDDSGGTTDITVTDSLTYTAGLKGANATNGVEIHTAAAATSTTLTLNGNIGNDQFNVETDAASDTDISLTIKGDLGIGTNVLSVTAASLDGTSGKGGKATIDLSAVKNVNASIIGSGNNDTIKGGDGADSITGGKGDDTITLGDGADTIIFSAVADNGNDTIKDFIKADDILKVSTLQTLTTNGTKTVLQGTADSSNKVDVATANVTTNGNGVIVIKDNVKTDWSDLDAIVKAALTVNGTATNNGKYVIAIDNGTDTHIYNYADTNDGFKADEDLILVATLTGISDATDIAAANIA